MKKYFSIFFIMLSSFSFCQSKNADTIINNVKTAFNEIKDYEVNLTIRTDIEFIKVPPMKAKIYFKQPDKIHFESQGFALVPRNGMFTSPMSFLNNDYTAIYVKNEELDGYNTSIVKVIPLNDKGDLILTTLWIDQEKNVIRKVEATTKTNGTFTLVLNYDNKIKYPLPSSMVLSVDMPHSNFKRELRRESSGKQDDNSNGSIKGNIYIDYSNYVVNNGIPDSVFQEQNNGRINNN